MNDSLPDTKKITFTAIALEDGYIPPFSGHILRGIILTYFTYHDPTLMSILHEENERRPYAIKDLRIVKFDSRRKSKQTGVYQILKGESFTFELMLIGSEIAQRSIISIIRENDLTLQLNHLPIAIERLEVTSIPLIDSRITEAKGRYYLRFLTPLQFMTLEDTPLPFPIPEKLFRSLGETWNDLLPHYQLDIETLTYLAKKYAYIRAYELKTTGVDLGKSGTQAGFKGWAQLMVRDMKEPEQLWLPHLLYFGQVMNVGRYRTAGMGQIEMQKTAIPSQQKD